MDRITELCFICGKPVPLESANTNEYGRAVHEECYVLRMKLEQATKPVRKSSETSASANLASPAQQRLA
jgi:hypothetical protein